MSSSGTFQYELYVQPLSLSDAHRLNTAMTILTALNPRPLLSRQPAVGRPESVGVAFTAKTFFQQDDVVTLVTVPQHGIDRVVVTASLPLLPSMRHLESIFNRLKAALDPAWATWSWELNPK